MLVLGIKEKEAKSRKTLRENGRFHVRATTLGVGQVPRPQKAIARNSASFWQPFVSPSIRPSKSEYGQMRQRVPGGAMISVAVFRDPRTLGRVRLSHQGTG
jgi:hypothetical protein